MISWRRDVRPATAKPKPRRPVVHRRLDAFWAGRRVVDSKADGSLVANTAATVVRTVVAHDQFQSTTGTNHAQCFANA